MKVNRAFYDNIFTYLLMYSCCCYANNTVLAGSVVTQGYLMAENGSHKFRPYDSTVHWLTRKFEPYFRKVTDETVKEFVAEHAADNPEYAKRIAFEVERRGYGAGITQDATEAGLWAAIKISVALLTATAVSLIKNKSVKWIGWAAAAPIIINQGIDLLRLLPRYRAGLYSSFLMAEARQQSIDEGHGDPFVQSTRQTNTLQEEKNKPQHPHNQLNDTHMLADAANAEAMEKLNRMGTPQISSQISSASASQPVTQQRSTAALV